jgi:hypothetical protein
VYLVIPQALSLASLNTQEPVDRLYGDLIFP